ncbi:MAG: RidA family protein [Hyphomonadaceae bacterium]|nr:RidA family protein [Hyphomonadaceae bacterium]
MSQGRRFLTTGSTFESELSYSRAIVQGDWCFVSGITGYDYSAMTLPADMGAQVSNAFDTMERVLAEAGFEPAHIARARYILCDRDDLGAAKPVIGARMADIRPAATMIIADMMVEEMRFELEVTAFRG